MQIAPKKDYDIGVIIGRFQLHELHDAHKDLFETVFKRHSKVVLLLGVAPTLGTKRNPLDFSTRKAMIESEYGSRLSAILPISDTRDDSLWSKQVDKKVKEVCQLGSVVIYGSRDSFIEHYNGSFDTCMLEPETYVSATDIRKKISKEVLSSSDFRAGVIYGITNTFPTVYSTVDIAIFDEKRNILLGKKPNEHFWRFIGGFVDINDESEENTVKREGMEETGLELGDIKFVSSLKINDWRYKNEPGRSIMTHLYTCKKIFGTPSPNDDIVELQWFPFTLDIRDKLTPEHQILFNELYTHIFKK
jgi:bifunctional NMN adenylyltransferase/nudix hydrolase